MRERGQGLVEATLVLLVFFGLALAVLDCGQVMFAHQALVERVREAARWGAMHAWEGPGPVVNFVLYHQVDAPTPAGPGYLGMTPANVSVTYCPPAPGRPEDESISIAIVNYESHFFSPWIARTVVSARPVLVTAPMEVRAAAAAK